MDKSAEERHLSSARDSLKQCINISIPNLELFKIPLDYSTIYHSGIDKVGGEAMYYEKWQRFGSGACCAWW